MKVLITSGGTKEHIDEVRVLTNISTGRLGAQIAFAFSLSGKIEKIYYLCSKGSELPQNRIKEDNLIEIIYADSVKEVYNAMENIVPEVDIVIHAMALSDFGFAPAKTKLKSNDPQAFIDSLRERIIVNPKVISFIKKWNSKTKLISFKFEVGKTHEELVEVAKESMQKNNGDYVVANDKLEMKENNAHIAYIIDKTGKEIKCNSKLDISLNLANLLLLS